MGSEQLKELERTNRMLENASNAIFDYWNIYSNATTWQFWVLLGLLIAPLIAMYFLIDRKKALLIGFFGFNVHVWFHYCDLYTSTHGLTNFPYSAFPFLPVSVTLDTSLIPVSYMLLYQWTLNRNKNYYLHATLLSAFISFLFKPALVAYNLFYMYRGMNYFYIFLLYLLIAFLSKWITDLFVHMQQERKEAAEPPFHRTYSLKRFFPGKEKAK